MGSSWTVSFPIDEKNWNRVTEAISITYKQENWVKLGINIKEKRTEWATSRRNLNCDSVKYWVAIL